MKLKHLALTVAPIAATCAVVLGSPGAAGAASSLKACKSPGQEIGHIRVRETSCGVAVKVIGADAQGKRADGFRCKVTGKISTGVKVTCKRGTAEILYNVYED
jgi:hypothetical protein